MATPVVSQLTVKGALVSSAPRATPSRKNCTPATPTLSDAPAVTLTVRVIENSSCRKPLNTVAVSEAMSVEKVPTVDRTLSRNPPPATRIRS